MGTVLLVGFVACLLGCSSSTSASGPRAIPAPTTTRPAKQPSVTTPAGGPAIGTFNAPASFVCLAQDPSQAQVTLGWIVPSATVVTVELDGRTLPRGIRDTVPYVVPAGKAVGPGATVVFACDDTRHTITVNWRVRASPATTRVVSVARATGS